MTLADLDLEDLDGLLDLAPDDDDGDGDAEDDGAGPDDDAPTPSRVQWTSLIGRRQAAAHARLMATLNDSPIRAVCLDDPAWISEDLEVQRHAAKLCAECPCLDPCAAYVAEHREWSGVWAGTLPPLRGHGRRHWTTSTGQDTGGRRHTTAHAPTCRRPGWTDEPPTEDEALIVSRCDGCGAVQLRAPDDQDDDAEDDAAPAPTTPAAITEPLPAASTREEHTRAHP